MLGSVFCCSFEPKEGKLIVSGGEDDKAYVWNTVDGKVFMECGNHQDSVTCALFSHDGTFLATGDMGGLIQVWKMATKSLVWSFEMGDLNVCQYIQVTSYPMNHDTQLHHFLCSGSSGIRHLMSCLLGLSPAKHGCGKYLLAIAKHLRVMENETNAEKSYPTVTSNFFLIPSFLTIS